MWNCEFIHLYSILKNCRIVIGEAASVLKHCKNPINAHWKSIVDAVIMHRQQKKTI